VNRRHSANEELLAVRQRAADFETNVPPKRRKSLGQFFTGMPLSRLLAALAVRPDCRSILDPMAGSGDLLDAAIERCLAVGAPLSAVDAIEIHDATAAICEERLSTWQKLLPKTQFGVSARNAFDVATARERPPDGYDLVITNPPFVRYQSYADSTDESSGETASSIRRGLVQAVGMAAPPEEQGAWQELARGYSGHADMSVPSWLLAASMVKPGGVLALVVPATWQTRDYAVILQYLLARFFNLDMVIADKQPGWFSDALVRTHLLVATRVTTEEALVPLRVRRSDDRYSCWIDIDSSASLGGSLVAGAFQDDDPDHALAVWIRGSNYQGDHREGLSVTERLLSRQSSSVLVRSRHASWLKKLEPPIDKRRLSVLPAGSHLHLLPQAIADLVGGTTAEVAQLEETGIGVGQGLRTGCNDFFYVQLIERLGVESARVSTSSSLGGRHLSVPMKALEPVLRRQSELDAYHRGDPLSSHVLDLRRYVLPEDFAQLEDSHPLGTDLGYQMPTIMRNELADHVRGAASTPYSKSRKKTRISELSAVKTNVSPARRGRSPRAPRFWYMLPNFVRRHLPDLFIARVNHLSPEVTTNRQPPVLIDANFTTLWADDDRWTSDSVVAVLSSTWARACMEALGTPMGGGALKLEATQIRRLPLPRFTRGDNSKLASLGQLLRRDPPEAPALIGRIDDLLAGALYRVQAEDPTVLRLTERLKRYCQAAQASRQVRRGVSQESKREG
jgi:hypothetical protein